MKRREEDTFRFRPPALGFRLRNSRAVERVDPYTCVAVYPGDHLAPPAGRLARDAAARGEQTIVSKRCLAFRESVDTVFCVI